MANRTIGEFKYEVAPLPARAALELMPLVAPLAGLLDVIGGAPLDATLANVLKGFPPGSLTKIVDALATRTTLQNVKGGEIQSLVPELLDLHFAGPRMADMFDWLAFSLELNYADFFRGCVKRLINLSTLKNSSQATTPTS